MAMRCLQCGHIEDDETPSIPDGLSLDEGLGRRSSSSRCPECRGMMSPIQLCRLVPPPVVVRVEPPRPRPILDYLLVDGHLGNYGPPPVEALAFVKVEGLIASPGDYLPPFNGCLLRVQYKFGPWNVFVPWPAVWLIRGSDYAPAKNRYGFAPSAEFGVPTFSGETAPKLGMGTVAPFAYLTVGGHMYTPEVPFIFGEAISGFTYRSIAGAVRKGMSVEEAVKQFIPSRK
ncbi:hypothetical protein LZ198_35105 [Myxococcus sp. K15C18031901]|uniref:hypothetical protein n=1 Tax=Myxococcus dinghuensis TaxID=2906761 RepID=UPI0020A82973|nr:hypothetical protein [Myxococcus dinghuensis]MCP3104112.1 hypothetical protein [Myxococcus dinghuensis]